MVRAGGRAPREQIQWWWMWIRHAWRLRSAEVGHKQTVSGQGNRLAGGMRRAEGFVAESRQAMTRRKGHSGRRGYPLAPSSG